MTPPAPEARRRALPAWARSLGKSFLIGAALGAAGYGVGYAAAHWLFPGLALPELDLRWSDGLALITAAVLAVSALLVLVASADPARLARLLKLEGPASPPETAQARLQAAVMGLSGVILLLPAAFSLAGTEPLVALGVILALLAGHSWMNLRVYRRGDELVRRVALESAAVTFWIGQGLLFVWAAAERLGVAPPLTAWDIYVVLLTLYLFGAVFAGGRRGVA